MTSHHSISCNSSHLRNLKDCCSTKDGFRCVHHQLTNGLKYTTKKPQKCITARPIYYPRHHPGQYWSDRGFRGWCSARIQNKCSRCLSFWVLFWYSFLFLISQMLLSKWSADHLRFYLYLAKRRREEYNMTTTNALLSFSELKLSTQFHFGEHEQKHHLITYPCMQPNLVSRHTSVYL